MNILIFLSVAVGTYYLMSVLQTVLHRYYGHTKRIRKVYSAHALGHHGHYHRNNLQTERFVDLESHALNYYGIPIAVVAALAYLVGGALVMIANLIGVFATFRWHLYLHEHYHLIDSPLERFTWFRKKSGCILSTIVMLATTSRSSNSGLTTLWVRARKTSGRHFDPC